MSTALLAETKNHIAILENRRTQLLQELNQVDVELSAAKARHAKLINQILPVALLPNEILSSIFLLCCGLKVTYTRTTRPLARPFEVVVSHVSTHWRNVALGTPLLWNTIHSFVTNESRKHALERLSAHLKRSDQSLLTISLYISVSHGIREVLYHLTPHVQRWFRLSISIDPGSPEDIYVPFQPLLAPNLVHLSLHIGLDDPTMPRTEYPEICPTILLQAPSLTFVRVAGKIVGNLSPPLSTTQTFDVDAWPKNLMSLTQFHSLLNALPCLVHLSLTGLSIYLPRDPLKTTEPILLPLLRSLRIRGHATPCHRLLSLLCLPKLESLSLQDIGTFDSVVIPSLHTLILSSCDLSLVDLENLFRSFPRVATLGIDNSIPEIYPLLTPDAGSSTRITWPELKRISLRKIPFRDVTPFVDGCSRRLQCGSPLQCVYLDRPSRTAAKRRGLLDRLRELLPVENVDEYEPWPAGLGNEDSDDVWY